MAEAHDLLVIEESFWRAAGDADRYAAHLAPDALHVFPGMGVLDRGTVLAGVADAEPWESVEMLAPRVVDLGRDAAALVYDAHAMRAGGAPYDAGISSVYRRRDDDWELVLHQQTPR
jgi:hypothetical protein